MNLLEYLTKTSLTCVALAYTVQSAGEDGLLSSVFLFPAVWRIESKSVLVLTKSVQIWPSHFICWPSYWWPGKRQVSVGIYCVLSKTFDLVDHEILCTQLECYGVRVVALSWFKSYLSQITRFIKIALPKSDLIVNKYVVTQKNGHSRPSPFYSLYEWY